MTDFLVDLLPYNLREFSSGISSGIFPHPYRYFPFDKQHCTLTFSSWSFDSRSIDMLASTYPITTKENYVVSSEWKVGIFGFGV